MNSPPTASTPIPDDRYRLLVENIKDYAIYMLTPEGIVSSWNAGAERFKGYTSDEIIGKSFSAFYTPDDRMIGLPRMALEAARRDGRFEAEGWRLRKDGTKFWASVVIDSIADTSGNIIGFAKITRDMTDRRIGEEQLRRSEELFRMLVNGVTDYAIYMLSPSGLITNWNMGAERIKGYVDSDVVGTHFSRFYTPEDAKAGLPQTALSTAANEGRFKNEGWRVRKDGSRFWAHVVIDPIYDDSSELIGFAKITRDISERRKAEAEMELARAALVQSQKTEAIGRLTGGIAHDFNNLLSAILGNLDLMRLKLSQDKVEDIPSLLKSAIAATQRSAALTHRLLAYARRQTLSPSTIQPDELVVSILDLMQRSVGPEITLVTQLDENTWRTTCDKSQLENALLNLVINARDAMPHGGEITLRTWNAPAQEAMKDLGKDARNRDYVVLEVIDSGTGMTPDVIEHAFEPFYTTKASGEGSGLGLSMVQGFIAQSDGRVVVRSTLGSGTTIALYLPRAAGNVQSDDDDPAAREERLNAVSPDVAKRILLVDDEAGVRTPLREMLRHSGYEIAEAGDASEALRIYDRKDAQFDMLITDIGLPGGMNGKQLAGAIRASSPDLRVMFITGYADLNVLGGTTMERRTRILTKPFSMEDFLLAVQEHLET